MLLALHCPMMYLMPVGCGIGVLLEYVRRMVYSVRVASVMLGERTEMSSVGFFMQWEVPEMLNREGEDCYR